jgi:excisionase family DNA binding protein
VASEFAQVDVEASGVRTRTDGPVGAVSATGRRADVDELLTVRQVAELLQLPASTVADYARRGLIPSIKLGRHRRYLRDDVLDAVTGRRGR